MMSTSNTVFYRSKKANVEWMFYFSVTASGGRQEGKLGTQVSRMGTHSHGLGCLHNGRWFYHVSAALRALKLADRYKPGLLPGLLGEVPMRTRRSDTRTHAACSIQKCHMGRQPCRHCGHSETRNSQRANIQRSL